MRFIPRGTMTAHELFVLARVFKWTWILSVVFLVLVVYLGVTECHGTSLPECGEYAGMAEFVGAFAFVATFIAWAKAETTYYVVRLRESGIPGSAVVLEARNESYDEAGGWQARVVLDVESAERPPFRVEATVHVHDVAAVFPLGARADVFYDPGDLRKIVIRERPMGRRPGDHECSSAFDSLSVVLIDGQPPAAPGAGFSGARRARR